MRKNDNSEACLVPALLLLFFAIIFYSGINKYYLGQICIKFAPYLNQKIANWVLNMVLFWRFVADVAHLISPH